MVDMRVVQHGLTRDTTNIQTSSTEGTPFLNARSLETQLGCFNRCNVSTGSTTDDDDIVGL